MGFSGLSDWEEQEAERRKEWSRLRWPPRRFECPQCGGHKRWPLKDETLWECASPECHHQISRTAGTLFHQSRISLEKWELAAEKAVRPEGLSAEELQKELDVSYRTAWSMLRRLRCAMVSDRVLDGRVDVDIVSCAHLAGTLRQTRTVTNTWIMVAVKERKVGASYAQAEVIAAAPSRKTLIQFVRRCVEPLSTIIISKTEPLTFLPSIAGEFDYEIVWHDGCSVSSLPRVRDVLGRYKEWMINTHGKVAIQYLQRYLNEFTFRFNHRRRGPDPIEIIRNSLRMSPLPDVLPAGRSERTGVRSASRSFG